MHSYGSEQGPAAGFCRERNKSSGYIKDGEFLKDVSAAWNDSAVTCELSVTQIQIVYWPRATKGDG
jgi:hypothetical protein